MAGTTLSRAVRLRRLESLVGVVNGKRLPAVGIYVCAEGEDGPPAEWLAARKPDDICVVILPALPDEPPPDDTPQAEAPAPPVWRQVGDAWWIDNREARAEEILARGLPAHYDSINATQPEEVN